MKIRQYIKNHPVKSSIFVIFVLLGAFILVSSLVDGIKIRQATRDLGSLEQGFISLGKGEVERLGGCGRFDTKMGPGARSCQENITVSVYAPTEEEADDALESMRNVIHDTQNYESGETGGLPNHVKNDTSTHRFGAREYQHSTGKTCVAGYDYKEKESSFTLRFTCDTTPWFTRNISKGRLFGL